MIELLNNIALGIGWIFCGLGIIALLLNRDVFALAKQITNFGKERVSTFVEIMTDDDYDDLVQLKAAGFTVGDAYKSLTDPAKEAFDKLQAKGVNFDKLAAVVDREALISQNEDIMGMLATPEVKARSLTAMKDAVTPEKKL